MEISNTLYGSYYSKDVPVIKVQTSSANNVTLQVNMQICDPSHQLETVSEETYTPDTDKCIYIRGIGEMADDFWNVYNPKTADGLKDAAVTVQLELSQEVTTTDDSGTETTTTETLEESFLVLWSSVKTPYTDNVIGLRILSRRRNFTLLPDMPLRIAYLVPANQKFVVQTLRVVYRDTDNDGYASQVTQNTSGNALVPSFVIDGSTTLDDVVELLKSQLSLDIPADDIIKVGMYIGTSLNDAPVDGISWKIERRNQMNAQRFLFANCFGVPEEIIFNGKEEETLESEAEFGYYGENYVRLSDEQTVTHTARSGYISLVEYQTIIDMTNSEYVYVMVDGEWQRITITGYDISRKNNAGMPCAVSLNYRYADKTQRTFEAETVGDEIMGLFEDTYTEVYD